MGSGVCAFVVCLRRRRSLVKRREAIKQRDKLVCRRRLLCIGRQGWLEKFDIDICKAIAVAILSDKISLISWAQHRHSGGNGGSDLPNDDHVA
jgi:hypothetical protein